MSAGEVDKSMYMLSEFVTVCEMVGVTVDPYVMIELTYPVEIYAPSTPGTAPITGRPSGVQGRIHAYVSQAGRQAHSQSVIPLVMTVFSCSN